MNAATKPAPFEPDTAAIIGEATAHLGTLARLFAVTDADLESGDYSGSPPERRREYNASVQGIAEALECLGRQHERTTGKDGAA